MDSSAQKSSGVHWCRRRVTFNEIPEKVPKVPGKVWEAPVQSQVTFNRVPEKSEKGLGGFGAKAGQVQQGSGEGSGEGLGGFCAEPGQVQQGSRASSTGDSGEGLGGFGAKPSQVQQGSGEGSGGLGGSPFLVGISMKYTIHWGIPHYGNPQMDVHTCSSSYTHQAIVA